MDGSRSKLSLTVIDDDEKNAAAAAAAAAYSALYS